VEIASPLSAGREAEYAAFLGKFKCFVRDIKAYLNDPSLDCYSQWIFGDII
jgi:hypothetical protein